MAAGLKWPIIKFDDQYDNQLENVKNCYFNANPKLIMTLANLYISILYICTSVTMDLRFCSGLDQGGLLRPGNITGLKSPPLAI